MSRRNLLGNATLYFLGLGVICFEAWRWYFGYPSGAQVVVVPRLLDLKLSQIEPLFHLLFGWLGLTSLLSAESMPRLIANLHKPLELFSDQTTRARLSSPPTVIIAALVLFTAILISASNWTVRLTTEYEVVAFTPPGQSASLMDAAGISRRTSVVGRSLPIAIAGIRPRETAVVLIRDKYNLLTLDALCIDRGILRPPRIKHCNIEQAAPNHEADGVRAMGLFRVHVFGPLRWHQAKVDIPFTTYHQARLIGGWIEPGEPNDDRETNDQAYADAFFQVLYKQRDVFRRWVANGSIERDGRRVVRLSLDDYQLDIEFGRGRVITGGDWNPVFREARSISVQELRRLDYASP